MILNWDFSDLAGQISLNDASTIPVVDYRSLSIIGYYSGQGDDFISPSLGIKFSYDGQPGQYRYISFMPLWDATLRVTFHSSSSSQRTLHIALLENDGTLTDVAVGTAGADNVTVNAELLAGEVYYIWITGGGTGYITALHYEA